MITKPATAAEEDRQWHLDKRVPLALTGALLVQTFVIGWWTSSLSERVTNLEKRDASGQLNSIAIDLAVLKENVKTTKEDISSMKTSFEMVLQQALQEKTTKR